MNQSFRSIALTIAALCFFTSPSIYSAAAKITSHQLLDSSAYERRLQFQINGKPLNLLLTPSYVTADTATFGENGVTLDNAKIKTFIGKVEGEDNSWARITIGQSAVRGIVSRHGQRYEVATDPSGSISIDPLTPGNTRSIENLTQNTNENHQTFSLAQKRTIARVAAPAVTKVAKIAIVVDSQYNDKFNGGGVEKALSIINAVDGIYREEFGLALEVQTIISFTEASTDPFIYGSVPIETMLRNFRQYRMHNNNLQDVSLVHLFTGNKNTDEPVGLAWIDTACRTDGYDVGISTFYRHDILLAAHEIAHNLGAHHDTDTACASESERVMWPYISSQTTQKFSSCTHEAVQLSLESSCHVPAIDLQLTLSVQNSKSLNATVKNNDNVQSSLSATVSFNLPQGTTVPGLPRNCTTTQSQIRCSVGSLLPGAEDLITLSLQSDSLTGSQLFNAEVELQGAIDVQSENNKATLSLHSGELTATTEIIERENNQTSNLPTGGNGGTGSLSLPGLLLLGTFLPLVSVRRA